MTTHSDRRPRRPHAVRGAVLLAAALLTPATASAQEDTFAWRGRIAAGRAIEIKGVSGDIRAVAATGDEVVVRAVKHGRRSDPEEVTIEVVEHDDGVTICAVYPSPRAGRPNECRPGGSGRMETRDNDVQVDFTIEVPPTVRFIGRNVNGGVEARSLTADVEAYTVNGGIDISTAGIARAKTVNGGIVARLGRADWVDDLEFETVNGGITIELPAVVDADVRAKTVNGGISSDFPLQVQGRFSSREIRGILGNGGRRLEIATVNGTIRLRRGT